MNPIHITKTKVILDLPEASVIIRKHTNDKDKCILIISGKSPFTYNEKVAVEIDSNFTLYENLVIPGISVLSMIIHSFLDQFYNEMTYHIRISFVNSNSISLVYFSKNSDTTFNIDIKDNRIQPLYIAHDFKAIKYNGIEEVSSKFKLKGKHYKELVYFFKQDGDIRYLQFTPAYRKLIGKLIKANVIEEALNIISQNISKEKANNIKREETVNLNFTNETRTEIELPSKPSSSVPSSDDDKEKLQPQPLDSNRFMKNFFNLFRVDNQELLKNNLSSEQPSSAAASNDEQKPVFLKPNHFILERFPINEEELLKNNLPTRNNLYIVKDKTPEFDNFINTIASLPDVDIKEFFNANREELLKNNLPTNTIKPESVNKETSNLVNNSTKTENVSVNITNKVNLNLEFYCTSTKDQFLLNYRGDLLFTELTVNKFLFLYRLPNEVGKIYITAANQYPIYNNMNMLTNKSNLQTFYILVEPNLDLENNLTELTKIVPEINLMADYIVEKIFKLGR
ncbi:MAG: hypothetical protein [Bacteriophage sp.]|nr:MAG: hypothetical protein [Bacteriophage sp.]